jgi:hypothetical protein
MVGWQLRQKPDLDRATAERETLVFMSRMPAWRQHPEVLAAIARG